ncbi:Os01g0393050 [Oryza sativa Japonica Group]|uniref:Os01g0393050 protein n=1 Tax=Oryza sativa subsp. japonica TaxID=39947 RepID=A0A0P0V2Z0_ORYSJ|nr:Os01g0393050 [Oryza sativa Japonica Group]
MSPPPPSHSPTLRHQPSRSVTYAVTAAHCYLTASRRSRLASTVTSPRDDVILAPPPSHYRPHAKSIRCGLLECLAVVDLLDLVEHGLHIAALAQVLPPHRAGFVHDLS